MSLRKPDIIVIGASAGGVATLPRILRDFPVDFPAAVLIVVHLSPSVPSLLPEVLRRAGPLLATHPVNGEEIKTGTIYVAPPDCHVLVTRNSIQLSRGPKENRQRPAIDPLFRTAAHAFGPRVIGVILTGALDDGAQGLQIVKEQGGIAVVQDPMDAMAPSMPQAALRSTHADRILPADQIGLALVELVSRPRQKGKVVVRGNGGTLPDPTGLIDANEQISTAGPPSSFICPDCSGPLWELKRGKSAHYQCLVGHAFGPENLLEADADALECALWIAIRTLESRASLLRRMSTNDQIVRWPLSTAGFEAKAKACEKDAEVLRAVLRKSAAASSTAAVVAQAANQRPRRRRDRSLSQSSPSRAEVVPYR